MKNKTFEDFFQEMNKKFNMSPLEIAINKLKTNICFWIEYGWRRGK